MKNSLNKTFSDLVHLIVVKLDDQINSSSVLRLNTMVLGDKKIRRCIVRTHRQEVIFDNCGKITFRHDKKEEEEETENYIDPGLTFNKICVRLHPKYKETS